MVFDFSDVGQWCSTRGNVTPLPPTSEQLAISEDILVVTTVCGDWRVVPGIQQVKRHHLQCPGHTSNREQVWSASDSVVPDSLPPHGL